MLTCALSDEFLDMRYRSSTCVKQKLRSVVDSIRTCVWGGHMNAAPRRQDHTRRSSKQLAFGIFIAGAVWCWWYTFLRLRDMFLYMKCQRGATTERVILDKIGWLHIGCKCAFSPISPPFLACNTFCQWVRIDSRCGGVIAKRVNRWCIWAYILLIVVNRLSQKSMMQI